MQQGQPAQPELRDLPAVLVLQAQLAPLARLVLVLQAQLAPLVLLEPTERTAPMVQREPPAQQAVPELPEQALLDPREPPEQLEPMEATELQAPPGLPARRERRDRKAYLEVQLTGEEPGLPQRLMLSTTPSMTMAQVMSVPMRTRLELALNPVWEAVGKPFGHY